MTGNFLFISGWAGYPELFPQLAGKGEFLLPFVRHSEEDVFAALTASEATNLVAWSTGAHMVLKQWESVVERFDKIVLLAPFLAFTDHTPEKLVRLMMRGMRRNAAEVVRQFHLSCGCKGEIQFDEKDAASLTEGLEYLCSSRAQAPTVGAEKTVLVHGDHDQIVSPQASEAIWKGIPGATRITLDCGHWIEEHDIVEIAFQD